MSAPLLASFLPSVALRCILAVAVGVAFVLATPLVAQPDPSANTMPMPAWRPDRLPIFFPPTPPPLGRTPLSAAATGSIVNAPRELALYVSETFYPALGTRLATGKLPEALHQRVRDYRARKLALLDELRAELDTAQHLEPNQRTTSLATLATRQTPKLVQLEDEQEALRRALVNGDIEWTALREWHLTDAVRRGFSPLEIAQVMRSYAFYHPDVSAPQRRLLREIATELLLSAENTTAATAAQPYLFFAPDLARVMLPDDVPAEVASLVARFETEKSALKKELYDTIAAADGRTLAFLRGNPIKALATRQAPAFAALETLAEEIRRGLASTGSTPAAAPSLPGNLDERVARMVQTYVGAQHDAAERVAALLAAARDLPLQAVYRVEPDSLKFVVVPRGARGRSARPASLSHAETERIDRVRTEISLIADDYSKAVSEMNAETAAIRRELGQMLGPQRAGEVERRLQFASRLALQREGGRTFAEYRTAVFEPGLSPPQRRLLFTGVVEAMQLPLPDAELQPVQRADRW